MGGDFFLSEESGGVGQLLADLVAGVLFHLRSVLILLFLLDLDQLLLELLLG